MKANCKQNGENGVKLTDITVLTAKSAQADTGKHVQRPLTYLPCVNNIQASKMSFFADSRYRNP